MMTIPKYDTEDKSERKTYNYSDDELIFEEFYLKCQTLENEKAKMLKIRENLLILNKNNENISKRLTKIKSEFEFYKSCLHKTLFNIMISTEKQIILSRKQIDEFLKKAQTSLEYYKVSPKKQELDELIIKNRHLQEEWKRQTDLLKLTKKQHAELVNVVMKTFQSKVCEFCDAVLRLNTGAIQVN